MKRRHCPVTPKPRGLKGRLSAQAAHPHGLPGRVLGRIWWFETAAANRRAVELLDPARDECVLEIGFGSGRTLGRLAERGCLVTGVDRSAAMLAGATRRYAELLDSGRLRLALGNVDSLPLPDASVDAALAAHNIYFWDDATAGLAEIARVLRPGGRVLLVTVDAAQGIPARFDPRSYRLSTEQQLLDQLDAAGFGAADVEREGVRLFVRARRAPASRTVAPAAGAVDG